MSNHCIYEPLAMTQYCRITICRDCGLIHFNLPYHISLQFEITQFLAIADAFTKAARTLRNPQEKSSSWKPVVVELERKH